MSDSYSALGTDNTETLRKKVLDSTCDVSAAVGGGGTIETASNLGAGQGVFKSKVAVDLQFRSLTATSSKIALANNTNDIGIDVTEANLTHDNIGGTLGVAKGGTGATTLTGVLKGNGTSAVTATAQLAVADGGTGAATLTGILKGNGTSAVTALTDPLPIANGGTSGATAAAGFDALSGMSAIGDILYGGTAGTRTRLAGNTSQYIRKVLTSLGSAGAATAPTWGVDPNLPSSGRITSQWAPVSAAHSGTNKFGALTLGGGAGSNAVYTINSTDGAYVAYSTGTGSGIQSGLRNAVNCVYRLWNPRLKFRFRLNTLTTVKCYLGFRTTGTSPTSDDPDNGNNDVMFGFSSTVNATNWITWTNNASGATETTDTTIAANTSIHTMEIIADDANTKFTYSLDGAAAVDFISTIPASTAPLGVNLSVANTVAASNNVLDLFYVEMESDK